MKNLNLFTFMGACFVIFGSTALFGCSSEVFSTVEDYRSVMTIRIDSADYRFNTFHKLHTYQLIVKEDSNGDAQLLPLTTRGVAPSTIDHDRDDAILDELETQLEARGLQNVEDLADPETGEIPTADVMVLAQLIAQPTWDYSGLVEVTLSENEKLLVRYPGPSVNVSYDTESLVITMLDTAVTVQDHPAQYYPIWTAGIHGVYTDTSRLTVRLGIREAFNQSPYIKAAGPPPGGVE